MHAFRQFIENYTSIPDPDWKEVEQCLRKRSIKKGELILEEGKICRHLYFLESGFLRYFLWKDGLDKTKFFTIPPYCFTSQRSFNFEIPAEESIEVLEDGVIWEIKKTDRTRLLKLNSWNTFTRLLVQEVQFFTEQILIALQNETAEERYRKMLSNGDVILQKAPLKIVASYLGIAPQSLSRIRKQVS